jgi:hypothetical protein
MQRRSVLAMPFAPLVGFVPVCRCGESIRRWLFADPKVMVARVRAMGQQDEVAGLIVSAVLVVMVDIEAIRDRAAVVSFPDHAMKPNAIALKILATEVVADAHELLNGPRNDLDAHDFRSMLCDTAS